MKYLSLFTGIGGFELGIQQAYENKNKQWPVSTSHPRRDLSDSDSRMGGESEQRSICIGYSEIDKYATQIYQKHFPNHKNYGDITKIEADNIPDVDFLFGGFPCQAFSIAGKRKGFEDTRGTLFFDIARILKAKRPRLLLLENVKGLLSHDNGDTFKTIISTLDELGYDLQWQVLNSKNFGVPQNRERVFIVGHLRGTSRPEVFPIGESSRGDIEPQENTQRKRERVRGEIASTLAQRDYKGGNNLLDFRGKLEQSLNEDTPTALDLENHALHKDRFMCLQEPHHNKHRLIENSKIRRLTPKECERLQGFPDGWTEGVSDTQRYKCLGNAVTVNVIQAIMERLL